jgi:hypothetical protein
LSKKPAVLSGRNQSGRKPRERSQAKYPQKKIIEDIHWEMSLYS